MKPYALLIGALFALSVTQAQDNFTKATVFQTGGSRTDCFVRNWSYEGTPQSFAYCLQKGESTRPLELASVEAIEFEDGLRLEKHMIRFFQFNAATVNRKKADYETETNQVSGAYLVERMLQGSYSLYRFVDKYGYAHFYYRLASESQLQPLEFREFVDDNATIINKHEYRNQLMYLATSSSCEKKLAAQIERTDYRDQQLVKLFRQFNSCAGSAVTENKSAAGAKAVLRLSVAAGLAATSLTTNPPNPSNYPGLSNNAFSSKLGPLAAVAIELIPPSRQQNYLAGLEIIYHSYSAATDSLRPNTYLTGIGRMRFSALNIMPVVRFRLSKKPAKPFLEAGASARFLSKQTDDYAVHNSISGTVTHTPIFTGRSSTLGLMGGAGVEIKRFSVHARYLFPVQKASTYYSNILLMLQYALWDPGQPKKSR